MQIEVAPENYHIITSLASETRLKILAALSESPMNISELAKRLGITPTMVVKHIKSLEQTGLVVCDTLPGVRGTQKVCRMVDKFVVLLFDTHKEEKNSFTYSMPVGMYVDCAVSSPCGLATTQNVIGFTDDPIYFMDPQHAEASIVWFSSGWVEYALPNYLLTNQRLKQLRLSFELCSEAPGYNESWPSDIHFYINGKFLGYWTCPSDFGEKKGALTPKWWDFGTQYGMLKQITINERGTFIDGIPAGESGCSLSELNIDPRKPIRFRIASPADARYAGGINLLGRGFGNYDQDITVSLDYEED